VVAGRGEEVVGEAAVDAEFLSDEVLEGVAEHELSVEQDAEPAGQPRPG
jgi:hypothetical protein